MRGVLCVCVLWLAAVAGASAHGSTWPVDIGARLKAMAAARHEPVGVAAMVIEDGRIVGTGMQRRFTVDGVLALPLAMAALDARDRGRLKHDAHLRHRLHAVFAGDRRASARLLAQIGGVATVRSYLAGLGVTGMSVHADHGRLTGRATPLALLTLLERVQHPGALSVASRHLLVGLLRPDAKRMRIAGMAAQPWWLQDAQGWARTGLGVVRLPDGRHLAVVVSATGEALTGVAHAVVRRLWQWQLAPVQRVRFASR